MTPELALNVGRAVAWLFKGESRRPRFVIGTDTRVSADMIAHALVSGICSAGADAELLGVLPTPGVAYVTRQSGANAGIVVSASHNPYADNGIKIFGADGCKLAADAEAAIEQALASGRAADLSRSVSDIGRLRQAPDAAGRYAAFLKGCLPDGEKPLAGLKVAVDCANGATHQVAPAVLEGLGAAVELIHARPDGRNINDRCGSQHPEDLARKVVATAADCGLAFDGDGDRLVAVDEQGEVLSGDRILTVCARHLKQTGRLAHDTVVSTVMSNAGLGQALKRLGIRHLMSAVGDRSVMEAMRASGAVLGGEDSGHMIFSAHHTTGDGVLTALMLLDTAKRANAPLSQLKQIMTPFPQKLINVLVKSKPSLEKMDVIANEIKSVEAELGDKGRVLVRYSGTEPLCRVMVEGPTAEETERHCRRIAEVIATALG
jgi:phosphoglucosamine mutase